MDFLSSLDDFILVESIFCDFLLAETSLEEFLIANSSLVVFLLVMVWSEAS